MKYKIKDLDGFTNCVFGADSFIENFPEIESTGVELQKFGDFYYVMINGKKAHDSAFFSEEEMQYLEVK